MRFLSALTILFLSLPAFATLPDFAPLVEEQAEECIQNRRWIHERPELSRDEFETQAWLKRELLKIPGVELVDGEWETGVVALLRGGKPGPIVAWRTDMDALPITEVTGLPFASTRVDTLSNGRVTGVMHACGHDLHMAISLGMMRVLSQVRAEMPGTVLYIGEPAEEIGHGARMLLEAGIFEDGRMPKCAIALHDHPTIPIGKVGSCPGPGSANVDGFVLKVKGSGAHGAYPHKAIDPVSLAARIVLAMETIVAREISVNHPCVISVGRIEGGTRSNVIPDEVLLDATVRTRDDETRELIRAKIERTIYGLAEAAGAPEPELDYYFGTPAGYNDPELVAQCREVFRRVLGPENEIVYTAAMGGEDFSRFGREVPGFQFRLGIGRPDREMVLHRGDLDAPEECLATGVRLACEVIWDQLDRQ